MYVRASFVYYCGTSVILRLQNGQNVLKCALLLNACAGFVIRYRKFNLVMYIFVCKKSFKEPYPYLNKRNKIIE